MPLQTVAAISSYVVETLIEAVVSRYDCRDHTLAADGYGAYPTNQHWGQRGSYLVGTLRVF